MHHRQPTSFTDTLRMLGAVILAALAWPLRLVVAGLEWFVTEILARVVILPLLLVIHARRHVMEACMQTERRLALERARDATVVVDASAAAQLHHFKHVMTAIERVDRLHAHADPLSEESLEATTMVFHEALKRLQVLALDANLRDEIATDIEMIIARTRPAA